MGRLLFILNKSLQGFAHPFSLSLKCVVSFSLPEHLGTPLSTSQHLSCASLAPLSASSSSYLSTNIKDNSYHSRQVKEKKEIHYTTRNYKPSPPATFQSPLPHLPMTRLTGESLIPAVHATLAHKPPRP